MKSTKLILSISLGASLALLAPISHSQEPLLSASSSYTETINQIEQSQALLGVAKKRLEQLLLADIPAADTGTQESLEKAKALSGKLAEMGVEIQASNNKLAKVKDQLVRTNTIYQARQIKLQAAQQRAAALEADIQNNTDYISRQSGESQNYNDQIAAMSAQIEEAASETARLNEYIQKADTEVSLRNSLAADVVQEEQQHLAQVQAKQDRLNSLNNELVKLRKQVGGKQQKIAREQTKWAKVDKQIADRNAQQDKLNVSIQSSTNEISSIKAQLLTKDEEIAKAKVTTSRKREELTLEKKQIAALKKRVRSSQQGVRSAQKRLADSGQLVTEEIALKSTLIQEINDSKNQIVILKRSEIDMKAEIQQLAELLDRKSQDLAPLRAEIEVLRSKKSDVLNDQSQQEAQVRGINQQLVAAENRYQGLVNQLNQLRTEKQALQGL